MDPQDKDEAVRFKRVDKGTRSGVNVEGSDIFIGRSSANMELLELET